MEIKARKAGKARKGDQLAAGRRQEVGGQRSDDRGQTTASLLGNWRMRKLGN
jgi:hypothetical protein